MLLLGGQREFQLSLLICVAAESMAIHLAQCKYLKVKVKVFYLRLMEAKSRKPFFDTT